MEMGTEKNNKAEISTAELKKNRAFLCLECGKCTAVCPISTFNDSYSPRRMIADGLFYGGESFADDKLLWSCLTCQLCSRRCPVDVKYSELMRDYRAVAHNNGNGGNPTHSGVLHEIMEINTSPGLKQNRTEWLNGDLKTREEGDTLYFVGCLPYYEGLFSKDLEFSPISIAKDSVKIMNYLGIEPVVMNNERCCGHDLYWLGQLEKFDELARLNQELISKTGAKRVITSCPECALSLKQLYPERLGQKGIEVKHITEIVSENLDKFNFKPITGIATFQDPCRLGRFLDIYEQPRESIKKIPGVEFKEMAHNGLAANCCGTTNWTNCDITSRMIQQSRLDEAEATGADTLITSCPKCQIHFRCTCHAENAKGTDLKLIDFVNFIASALDGKK